MANFYTDNPNLHFHLRHPLLKKIARLKEKDYSLKDQYDYAPLDYEDALHSYDQVLEIIGDVCGNIIAENAVSIDEEGPKLENNRVIYAKGTQENLEALNKANLMGYTLPREYGGLNMPLTTYVMANEMISRADGGFANIYGLQDCAETIHEFASEEIQKEYLPKFSQGDTAAMVLTEPDAGSDLQAVQLKADWDEKEQVWRLNGVKRFITNGNAEISLVLARSEDGSTDGRGLSLFLYERDGTVKIRRIEHKLGIIGSPTCELVFDNAPAKLIGTRKMGLIKYVMALMNAARLGIGAQSVGIAEAAYREAVKYAEEREQFDKPIIQFPAVYEMLTWMKVRIDAIRSLLYETARYVDIYKNYSFIEKDRKLEKDERNEMKQYQRLADVFTPLIKLMGSEYCNDIAYDAIQIHGGTGFMKDFPVERLYRDARITSIYEGTSQLQVVAAIRGVTNGTFIKRIREFIDTEINPEMEYLKKILAEMADEFEDITQLTMDKKDNELLDFHARRLVEMAANIIMGFLLVFDANRDIAYKKSAEIFTKKVFAENKDKATYIKNFDLKELSLFKIQ